MTDLNAQTAEEQNAAPAGGQEPEATPPSEETPAPILPTVAVHGRHGTESANDPTDQGQPNPPKKAKKPKKKPDAATNDDFDVEGHGDRLIGHLERIEKLEREKADFQKQYADGMKGIKEDIADAYGQASLDGFDTDMIDELLKLRKLTPEEREAAEKAKAARAKRLARYKKAAGIEQLELAL